MMRPLQYGPVVWRRVRAVRRSRHSHSHSSRRQTLRLRVDSRPLSTSTSAAGTASGASEDEEDPNFPLRRDIKYLGWALGDAIRHTPAHGQEAYASVEQLRGLAKAWRSSSSDKGPAGAPAGPQARAQLQALVDVAASMPSPMLAVVARAFSHFLALSNTAEAYHRIRRRRLRELRLGTLASRDDYAAVPAQPLNTTLGTVQSLLAAHHSAQGTGDSRAAGAGGGGAGAASPEQIYEALCTQCVEIVLTAHPTEVTRRTIVQRHRDIERALGALDHEETLSWHDRRREEAQLLRQVETLWWTDEVRREKPTPLKEARHGLEIVATSMWKAVPAYLRKLDAELLVTPGIERALPPE
jgi:phosphoenolpyruvate carboxylase